MAEYFFNNKINLLNLKNNFQADSAGIFAEKGIHATKETVTCLKKRNIDISTHTSKPVNLTLIRNAFLVLTMTFSQLNYLNNKYPEQKNKIFLFGEYIGINTKNNEAGKEIEDPFGEDLCIYEKICNQIDIGIQELINILR